MIQALRRLGMLVVMAMAVLAATFPAPTPPPPDISVVNCSASYSPTRTFCVSWDSAGDSLGAAEQYVVVHRLLNKEGWPGFWFDAIQVTRTATVDTLTVQVPALGDSLIVRVTVRSQRRGVTSTDSAWTNYIVKRRDFPPPAPASVAVDTTE